MRVMDIIAYYVHSVKSYVINYCVFSCDHILLVFYFITIILITL